MPNNVPRYTQTQVKKQAHHQNLVTNFSPANYSKTNPLIKSHKLPKYMSSPAKVNIFKNINKEKVHVYSREKTKFTDNNKQKNPFKGFRADFSKISHKNNKLQKRKFIVKPSHSYKKRYGKKVDYKKKTSGKSLFKFKKSGEIYFTKDLEAFSRRRKKFHYKLFNERYLIKTYRKKKKNVIRRRRVFRIFLLRCRVETIAQNAKLRRYFKRKARAKKYIALAKRKRKLLEKRKKNRERKKQRQQKEQKKYN